MVRFQKQLRRCRRAVSDIIGNLLILAITVTLFSSVMFYVATMPSPQEQTYAEMSYDISELSGNARWVNVTHQGGQTLYGANTNIYLFKSNTLVSLKISDSNNLIGDEWIPGETWSYRLTGIAEDTPLSMLIIDVEHNAKVWESQLIGGQVAGSYAPIITNRGTNPSPIVDGSTFTFYASVMDPNGDLNRSSVYINATSIGRGIIPLLDPDNNGVFTSASLPGSLSYNGKVVMVYAEDFDGRNTSSRLTLTATQAGGGNTNNSYGPYGPYNNYSSYLVNGTYPPDATGGESGGSTGTTFYYIRRAADQVITRDFQPGEALYIEIYSDGLDNLALENSFIMTNPSTGGALTPPTKLVNAFTYGGIFATFHRYVINMTAPNLPLTFPMQITLRDNDGTRVNIADTISVAGANYPVLKTYKLVAGQLQPCTSFNHTDVVYLKLITKDVDSTITSVVVSDIQVNDYSGKYVIKQTLPAPIVYTTGSAPDPAKNAPLSQVYKTSKTGTSPARQFDYIVTDSAYTIQIDLLRPNNDWWLPGKNAYTMFIPVLTDSGNYGIGETYYNLNYQLNVTAPRSTTDLVTSVGSGAFTWSASGATWEDNKLVWYKNGERFDQWDATIIDADTYNGPIGMELADIDNDGFQDVVVGFQDQSISIAWYRNLKSDGSAWSTLPYTICTSFDAYAGTQHVADGTNKGLTNEDSSVWRTAGWGDDRFASGYYAVNEIVGAIRSGDFDGDGDLDIVASFIHAVVYTSATGTNDADYTNSYGMFFNRGIYVFWNDGSWTKTQLLGTNTYTSENNNPAAMDLAVADLNQDGVDDIVAVYETGVTNIWINQWKQIIGTTATPKIAAFGTGSLVPAANVPTTTGNTLPWDHTQRTPSVAIADVDNNGYPDIIRTSTGISGTSRTVTVIRTMESTPTNYLRTPFAEYSTESEISVSRTGSMANLTANDGSYETLTEVYKNTSVLFGIPDQKESTAPNIDNTGQNINNIKTDDEVTYDVGPSQTMHIRSFLTESTYSSKPVTQVILKVQYSATADYDGSTHIQYSLDGSNLIDTTLLPTSSMLNVNGTYDLYLQGIDTWGEVQALRVLFINNGAHGTVQFDYIRLEVKFAETRWMEWIYEVENLPTQMTHLLNMSANVVSTGEAFNVFYSIDGTIWYTAFTFDSTTETQKEIMLPYTTNSEYFVRVSADDSSSSDVTNNSLAIDFLGIRHVSPRVNWPLTDVRTVSYTMQNSLEYITCLAVGDVGSVINDYPDNFADIIVGTSYVGSASSTHTLLVSFGNGNSFSASEAIGTSALSVAVGSQNAIYNAQTIALGDFNGDGYLDIALIISFAPGRSGGTAPSIWLYRNDPAVGQWGEQVLNALAAGESAINVQAGNVDISILYPILGVLGLVAMEGVISKADRRRKK